MVCSRMEPTAPSDGDGQLEDGGNATVRATPPSGARDVQVLVAALVVVLMPFPVIVGSLMAHRGSYDFQAIIFPSDVAVFALVAVCAVDICRGARRLGAVLTTFVVLLLLLTVSFLVHPADRGFLNLVRYAGTLSLAWVIATVRDRTQRALVLGAVVLTVASQALIALAQLIARSDIGLGRLGEFPDPFYTFSGDVIAPQGTMVHIYLLAGFALLGSTIAVGAWLRAPRSKMWLAAAAICVAPVAVTYSRAAAVGLALAVVTLAVAAAVTRRREPLAAAGALALTVAVAIAIWPGGWTERVTAPSQGRRSIESSATGRTALMRQARDVILDEPIFGVGTGRYVIALRDRHVDPRTSGGALKPVHDVPLLAGAEAGIGALVAITALLVLLALRAWKAAAAGIAAFVAFLPYVVLDHFPYSFPQGIVMTGIWIGFIELTAREGQREGRAITRAASG
jgi:O-antigen ligase